MALSGAKQVGSPEDVAAILDRQSELTRSVTCLSLGGREPQEIRAEHGQTHAG
jgi:hypothetical protein